MTRDATTAFARTLVDEWVRHGVTDACLAPGSRSAPLALALAGDERIRVHVHLDERSASFFALGLARATGRPALAAVHVGYRRRQLPPGGARGAPRARPDDRVHRRPAARAARHRRRADRRPGEALRRRGALVPRGRACPTIDPASVPSGAALASRAVAEALGPPAGPVHLNLPFREPLVPTGDDAGRRARPLRRPTVDRARARACRHRRSRCSTRSRTSWPTGPGASSSPVGVRASGPSTVLRFAEAAGWPVLADPLSNLRVPGTVSRVRPAAARPRDSPTPTAPTSCCASVRPPPTRSTLQWLDPTVDQVLVDPDDAWLDPLHAVSGRMVADAELLLGALADAVDVIVDEDWVRTVARRRRRRPQRAIDGLIDGWDDAVRRAASRVTSWPRRPRAASLVVASSMPVRDVESFAAAREGVTFHANRGVNGIDGFVSTALGIAAAARRRRTDGRAASATSASCTTATGSSARPTAASTPTFVVIDNGGGGIFSFLPAGRPPRALRGAVRHAATGRPRRAGRGARHPRRRGRRRRRARARAR